MEGLRGAILNFLASGWQAWVMAVLLALVLAGGLAVHRAHAALEEPPTHLRRTSHRS